MPLEGYSGPRAPSQLIEDSSPIIFNLCAEKGGNQDEEGIDDRRKVPALQGSLRLSLACARRTAHKVALACPAQVR